MRVAMSFAVMLSQVYNSLINGVWAELRIRTSGTRWASWEIVTDRYRTASQPYDRIKTVQEALMELQEHLPGLSEQ